MPVQLALEDLQQILIDAGVLKIMGEEQRRRVVVDYVPARKAMAIAREPENVRLAPYKLQPIEVVYQLEETMIGGVIYAAITVGDRVVIEPFRFANYSDLINREFTTVEPGDKRRGHPMRHDQGYRKK